MMLDILAKMLAWPAVTNWLIRRAHRTPYFHLTGDDGGVYMERYWLFNPPNSDGSGRRWGEWVLSARLHCIMRGDQGEYLHDHPWNARTFILQGWYQERRLEHNDSRHVIRIWTRVAGDTVRLKFGEYHHIDAVSPDGVWTLFITWRKRGTWGFLVNGAKRPWRIHLGIDNNKKSAPGQSPTP